MMQASPKGGISPKDTMTSSQTPKSRSFSDPPNALSTLAPSPTFQERRPGSKDDNSLPITPKALQRPELFSRGLSLHLPSRDNSSMPAPAVPLSPELDKHNIYSQSEVLAQNALQRESQQHSPATSLPRHSRGLDFSRASTNLHHSTLAGRRSPDSSPTLTQKGMMIPPRKGSISSMMLDSPNLGPSNTGAPLANEKSAVSSSVGSLNILGSESESSDSDEDASMGGYDVDDAVFTTPQVHKLQNPNTAATPFTTQTTASPIAAGNTGWGTGSNFSPAAASLMKNIRRSRLRKGGKRNRKGSSSASNSGYSSHASPRNTSPPPLRSIESSTNSGSFSWSKASQNRRESLAMGTDGHHLSSGNDSGDEATAPSTPGVVRRVVTRRGNLLPKTKGFARIRAALAEEATPQDADVRREAETIRQVRERDNSVSEFDLERPQTATEASSPNLLPAVPESAQENFDQELDNEPTLDNPNKGLGMLNFSAQASRNSGGMNYWNRFDPSSMRTPPPPSFPGHSSSAMSDVNMDSPLPSENRSSFPVNRRFRAASNASDAESINTNAAAPNFPAATSDDVHLKNFKRRREDDSDIASIKRRAVSPGMSSQNSPVLTHSPSQRDSINGWGAPPERKRDGQALSGDAMRLSMQNTPDLQPVRSGSNGSNISMASGSTVPGGKKLGMQGMVDTNDGLMKMSIE